MEPATTPVVMITRGKQKKRAEEAEERASKKAAISPKVPVPKTPRVYAIPTTAMFNLIKKIAGAKAKQEILRKAQLEWDQSFDDIMKLCKARSKFKANSDARGAWSSTMAIAVHDNTKHPGVAAVLEVEEDWEVFKSEFRQYTSTTGKIYAFTIVYTFKALPLDITQVTRPMTASDDVFSDNDEFFTTGTPTQIDVTPRSASTPTPRSSVTSRRKDSLRIAPRSFSEAMNTIQKLHKCRACQGARLCYIPIPGMKHCHISNKGLSTWTQAVMDEKATMHRHPDNLPELKEWIEENVNYAKVKAEAQSNTYRMPVAAPNGWGYYPFNRQPQEIPDYMQKQPEIVPREAASSPPNDEEDSFDLLRQWIKYATSQHRHCSTVEIEPIIARCRQGFMGFEQSEQIKKIIKNAKNEPWHEVREFGIERGIAAVMHLELRTWLAVYKATKN